jgi:hypothetical protein
MLVGNVESRPHLDSHRSCCTDARKCRIPKSSQLSVIVSASRGIDSLHRLVGAEGLESPVRNIMDRPDSLALRKYDAVEVESRANTSKLQLQWKCQAGDSLEKTG